MSQNDYPSLKPVTPGGTDASSFSMVGIPTFRFSTETDYSYGRAWHTLYDLYSELVPYTEHQEHSALVTAVVAYGIANLDEPLTREGSYLPDGLFADITTTSGARVIASLDYENAPLQTANFMRLFEGSEGEAPGGGRGGPASPPVGRIADVGGGRINAVVESEIQKSVAVAELPLNPEPCGEARWPWGSGAVGSEQLLPHPGWRPGAGWEVHGPGPGRRRGSRSW